MRTDSYGEYKDKLRNLLLNMESCCAEDGMPMLGTFVKDYEASLYNEIGRLTRQLHDSLTTFNTEEKILNLTEDDIPSAKERLRCIVTTTQQIIQNVLAIIEKSIPVSLKIGFKANDLHNEFLKITKQNDFNESFSGLFDNIAEFLTEAKDNSGLLHGHLTEILMAQECQDINGQIIKKITDLVQNVEGSLVNLIKITGKKTSAEKETNSDIKPVGPRVPGVDNQEDYVAGQDDVDQLLASLGF